MADRQVGGSGLTGSLEMGQGGGGLGLGFRTDRKVLIVLGSFGGHHKILPAFIRQQNQTGRGDGAGPESRGPDSQAAAETVEVASVLSEAASGLPQSALCLRP